MIELISARGNTTLESAVTLTKSLRWDIQSLGSRVEKAVAEEQLSRRGSSRAKSRAQNDMELKMIIMEMKNLLARIEDAVPLINLAITTSGVSLSTTLPPTVSPSRLLQASTFLTAGDSQYSMTRPRAQQIGPAFTLSMYMLFSGYAVPAHVEGLRERETTWKEVMHKAKVTLMRVPLDNVYDYPAPFSTETRTSDESKHRHIPSDSAAQEFAYQLLIVEDLDDDRFHSFEDDEPHPEPYSGVEQAGVREVIPIHEISKIFYADTGKILNIGTEGESNNPILLLKRDVNAAPPRRMMEREAEPSDESDDSHTVEGDESDREQSELDEQFRRESTADLHEQTAKLHDDAPKPDPPTFPWRLAPTLDLEWMAFEVFVDEPPTDSEADDVDATEPDTSPSPSAPTQTSGSKTPDLVDSLSNLHLRPSTPSDTPQPTPLTQTTSLVASSSPNAAHRPPRPAPPLSTALPAIKTSLSMLEMLIRLTALQQFQQTSHLAIPDEFLTFFLSESSTVGSGGDADLRRRVRREARLRVGFDPYDESPIKRRGEEYLAHSGEFYDESGGSSPGDFDDGETFPVNSRSQTPYSRGGTPSSPGGGVRQSVESPRGMLHASSPSPLLRRATTQPGQRGTRIRGLGLG